MPRQPAPCDALCVVILAFMRIDGAPCALRQLAGRGFCSLANPMTGRIAISHSALFFQGARLAGAAQVDNPCHGYFGPIMSLG